MYKSYCTEVKQRLNYYASWLPNSSFALGDYGRLEDKVFQREGNISDFGIRYIAGEPGPLADIEYASQHVTTIQTKLDAGEAAAGHKVGLSIGFSNAGECFIRLGGCRMTSFHNMQDIAGQVLSLRERGIWSDDWVVICQLLSADKTIIYISGDKGAQVKIGLKSDDIQSIGRAGVSFDSLSKSSISTAIEGDAGLVPLFSLAKVCNRKLSFKSPTFRPLSEGMGKIETLAEDFYVFEKIEENTEIS